MSGGCVLLLISTSISVRSALDALYPAAVKLVYRAGYGVERVRLEKGQEVEKDD